jgi:hypothetical protein
MYLYREHRTTCEKLEPSLFERHGMPAWIHWLGWSWPGLHFFLLKKYEILKDSEFSWRARRFRLALGIDLMIGLLSQRSRSI